MNTRRLHIIIIILFLVCFFSTEIMSNDENIDRAEWVLKSGDDAISTALRYTGFSELRTFVIDSTKLPQLVVLEDDQTPFLHQQINGKPLWKVTISVILEIRVEDKSGGSFQRFDENIREFDIYLDPKTGQLMKMLSGSDLKYPHKPQLASADVAEWVIIGEPVEPGDVLEIDPDNPGHYRKARGPCSNLVAGVVSTNPGFVLGSPLSTDDSRLATEDSALLALIGIVPVKVTNEGGPIQPGDLLVTSSIPGHAMRWDPDASSPCDLVGKALEPLDSGIGMIQVLLMH